jgi:2-C-methyl-D-erythritol 2,4-cyclodiphosphate synthase
MTMMVMTMTRCTYPPRRSIVILSLLSLLSAGCHHLCNAFSSVPRPLVAVAATSTTTASSSTGSITSSIGHRWNAAHQPILSNSIQRRLRPFFTSLQSFTKNNNEEEEEISSILRPSYPIEPLPLRIGHGFDIHRMVPLSEAGQPIIIGGVVVTHENQKWLDVDGKYTTPNSIYETQLGVLAHSDGDVIYHSLVDAIFGALTLPDIGQVFQDTDPRWKGCDSSKFMEYAYKVMQYYNYQIGNIDVTLILERPKVAKFKPQMKENIVKLLHTTEGRVNIKARTHERLDSVGELRGVSCHVVVTLEAKKTE